MRKVVVKIGSSIIAPDCKIDNALVLRLVKDILLAEEKGYKVILVTSGAIACGLNKLKLNKKPSDMHSLMAISSLGQIELMDTFNTKFKKYKKACSQLLLTWDDFDERKRFVNVRMTIDKLLKMSIVPIINENDVVSHEEIGLGDNDRLSALVANLVEAEQLIMLSDVEGLLERNRIINTVDCIDSKIESLVKKRVKAHTKGGMDTKLEAATIASFSGIKTRIANGRKKNVISRIVTGEDIGTLFKSSGKIGTARKRWVYSKPIKGSIRIDNGAKEALLDKGKSLLGVGIIDIDSGSGFRKGDAVAVVDSRGIALGCGIVNYNSDDFMDLKVKKFGKEVIHRDNFVKVIQGWCYNSYRRFSRKKLKKDK